MGDKYLPRLNRRQLITVLVVVGVLPAFAMTGAASSDTTSDFTVSSVADGTGAITDVAVPGIGTGIFVDYVPPRDGGGGGDGCAWSCIG